MEDEINRYLKRSIQSLFPRRRRRARPVQAARLARFTVPALAQPVPIPAAGARRRSPHAGYVRGHYLPRRPSRIAIGQPLFRVA